MTYKINEQDFFSDIADGIAVLIEVDTGIYYGFNALTTNIFENVCSGVDTEVLLDKLRLIKGFNDDVEKKYRSFLDELEKRGFIIKSDKGQDSANIKISEFSNDEFDFKISEYRDVAELLLADPIHHVKEDKGWEPNKSALK